MIKAYDRDEFSKRYFLLIDDQCPQMIGFFSRLFGAFPAARRPFKTYSVFDCVARLTIMLSVDIRFDHSHFLELIRLFFMQISSLILNMYNATNTDTLDALLLIFGIPIAFVWLTAGIGMVNSGIEKM